MYKQLKTLKDATVSINCKSGHEDDNLALKYTNSSVDPKTTTDILSMNAMPGQQMTCTFLYTSFIPRPSPNFPLLYCKQREAGKLGEGLGTRLALHHPSHSHIIFCYKHLVQVRIATHTCINSLLLTGFTSCSRPSWITVACSICS